MPATFVEHRVRGRVWLVLSMIAGAGAVYVNDRVDRREDTHELRRATVSATEETRRVGGGPPVATPYFPQATTPPESVEEGDIAGSRPVPRFPDVPVPVDEEEAGVPRAADDAIAPEVAAEAAEDVVAEADAAVEDAAPEANVAVVDTGLMYDPNAPYITPVLSVPVTAVATGVEQPPQPVGAGGTAADPNAELAGGFSADPTASAAGGVSDRGLVPAGGTAATPNATIAGGTPVGATGAGGGTAVPSTTSAGGTPTGSAGAIDTSAFVPNVQNTPFVTPQNQFVVPTAPVAAAPGFVPFVGAPVPFFFFVPPVGAFGVFTVQ